LASVKVQKKKVFYSAQRVSLPLKSNHYIELGKEFVVPHMNELKSTFRIIFPTILSDFNSLKIKPFFWIWLIWSQCSKDIWMWMPLNNLMGLCKVNRAVQVLASGVKENWTHKASSAQVNCPNQTHTERIRRLARGCFLYIANKPNYTGRNIQAQCKKLSEGLQRLPLELPSTDWVASNFYFLR
jgi:hypothetical protein